MRAFSVYAIADVVGNKVWVADEYVDYCMSGNAIEQFQYFRNGAFIGCDAAIPLAELVAGEIYPLCREARAAALMEAYRDNDGSLVLMQTIQGRMQGVAFHPSTTVPDHVQASYFTEHGFVGHTTHEALAEAVCEYADYQADGRAFLESIVKKPQH